MSGSPHYTRLLKARPAWHRALSGTSAMMLQSWVDQCDIQRVETGDASGRFSGRSGMQDWSDGVWLTDPTQGPPWRACLYSEDNTAAPAEGSDYFRSYGRGLCLEGRSRLVQPAAAIQRGAGSPTRSQNVESFTCLKRVLPMWTGVFLQAAQRKSKNQVSKEQNFSE